MIIAENTARPLSAVRDRVLALLGRLAREHGLRVGQPAAGPLGALAIPVVGEIRRIDVSGRVTLTPLSGGGTGIAVEIDRAPPLLVRAQLRRLVGEELRAALR